MATLTGSKGSLKYKGEKVAKVRQFDLNLSRDALDDTCVGDHARTYVPGLTGATGSATVLLDPTDDAGRAMLNTVTAKACEATQDPIEFLFDTASGMKIDAVGFLTSVGASVSVGDVQSASVSFQISGPVTGGF
jgi:hypothetical protein